MAALFQFFHNGQCWYSISIDTQKTRDPNFGGSVIWNFSVWLILMKWQPFLNFFIMAWCWYSISIDTRKTGDPNFGGVGNLKFFSKSILMKRQPFFNFFIMADADIFRFHWHWRHGHPFSFPTFSVGSVFPVTLPRFCFNINAWLCLKHFCMVTFLYFIQQSAKKIPPK